MTPEILITHFYNAFSDGDYLRMSECYHKDVSFSDPVFPNLRGKKVSAMWEMLLSNKNSNLKVTFSNVRLEGHKVTADWEAQYLFGPKKRRVLNKIHAEFILQDNKIIEHKDNFNLWKWSRQAMGPMGFLLGWTPFFQNKVQEMARKRLEAFINKSSK